MVSPPKTADGLTVNRARGPIMIQGLTGISGCLWEVFTPWDSVSPSVKWGMNAELMSQG